jgi:hypothetical protein
MHRINTQQKGGPCVVLLKLEILRAVDLVEERDTYEYDLVDA